MQVQQLLWRAGRAGSSAWHRFSIPCHKVLCETHYDAELCAAAWRLSRFEHEVRNATSLDVIEITLSSPRTHTHYIPYTIYIYIMFFFVFTCISICVRILHCDNKQAERSRIEILYSVERFKNDLLIDRIRYKCVLLVELLETTRTHLPAHTPRWHTHTHTP